MTFFKDVELSQKVLHSLLLYCPITGVFTRVDGKRLVNSATSGRCMVYVPGYRQFKAHRLAFLFMEGKWPENQVDHIDGNPLNNAWSNLRHATNAQNQQNARANRGSKSGILGVYKHGKKFRAGITLGGVKTVIGSFNTAEEANDAYLKVKRELHPFGEL